MKLLIAAIAISAALSASLGAAKAEAPGMPAAAIGPILTP